MRAAFVAFIIPALFVACGGGGNGSRPSPVLTAVTITAPGGGVLFVGETYTFTMNARLSDGTMITTGGTWGSDAPQVAEVNAVSGLVQIRGIGEATIYVDYQGQRGTQRIRSTVKYEGTLFATSLVTSCVDTGEWEAVDACGEFQTGFELGFSGKFTQSDGAVTAVMSLGDDNRGAPVTAQVRSAGVAILTSGLMIF